MKKVLFLLTILAISLFAITGCDKDDETPVDNPPSNVTTEVTRDSFELTLPTGCTSSETADGITINVPASVQSIELTTLVKTKEGYTSKFSLSSNGQVSAGTTVTTTQGTTKTIYLIVSKGDVTASFKLNFNFGTTYTVDFNLNGGDGEIESQTFDSLNSGYVTKPEVDPTREGFKFDGWYYDNKPYNFNSLVNSSFTLVAQWSQDTVDYTVNVLYWDNSEWKTFETYNCKGLAGSLVDVTEYKVLDGYVLDEEDFASQNLTISGNGSTVVDIKFRKLVNYTVELYFDSVLNNEKTLELEGLDGKDISFTPVFEDGYFINDELSILSGNVLSNGSLTLKVYYESNLVKNLVSVNGTDFDMSDVIKYIDGDDEPVIGYYNYHLTNKTVINLCNANLSITDATRQVLYLNKVLTGSYSFEVTIDMSSLDNETNSTYARQGIVLSNGSVELAIFPARWTSGNATNPTLEPGTGYWWIKSNSTDGALVSDAGLYAGVGKCVSPKFASEFTLKVERIGNSHINLYVDGELITILKADGLYDASTGNKSANTTFNNDLAALFSSDEMLIGFNHFNSLNFPNIVYKDMEFETIEVDDETEVKESIFSNDVSVNGQTWNQSTTYPVSSYDSEKEEILFSANNNANNGTTDVALRQNGVLYLKDVQTGSFELTYKVNVSQATDGSGQRVGFAITDGTNTIRVLQFWSGVQIIVNNNDSSLERNQSGLSWALGTKHNSSNASAFDECMMKILFDKENNQIVVSYATITNEVVGEYIEIVKLTTNGTFKADGTEIMTNDYDIFQKRVASFMDANEVVIGFCSFSPNTSNAVFSEIEFIQK